MVGMGLTFCLLALVPLSVIALSGLDNISDVATISWGRALGEWAFFSANLFALCAMLTSYWGLGGSFLTNIFDQFRLGNDEQPFKRLMVLVVAVPPFILAYSGMVSFVNALYFAGVFSGVILSIMPILILKGARQRVISPRLDLPGADNASANPDLHRIALSLQRRLRHRFRLWLPARGLVVALLMPPRSVYSGAGFYLSLICYILRNFIVSNSPE
jgi:hypothetical protein